VGTGLTSYEFYGTGLKGVIVTPLIALSRGPNLQPNLRQGCLGPRKTRNLRQGHARRGEAREPPVGTRELVHVPVLPGGF